jgi:hypothetical protein
MRRLFVFAALCGLLLSSCAATWHKVAGRTVTAPLYDDAAAVCTDAPILMGPLPTAYRTLHRMAIQGAWSYADSVTVLAGTTATFAGMFVPTGDAVTLRWWASDEGGAGCDTTYTVTPTSTRVPPGRVTLQ